MSTADSKRRDDDMSPITCANCGKGEEEIENLKLCMACKMVKYIVVENVKLLTVHNIRRNVENEPPSYMMKNYSNNRHH